MIQECATASLIASGTLVSGSCSLDSVGLLAGSDAATAVFRDGGSLGPIVWVLGADTTKGSSSHTFSSHARILKSLYVVLTGTSPTAVCAIELPASSQTIPA